jgi:hypothetical protein
MLAETIKGLYVKPTRYSCLILNTFRVRQMFLEVSNIKINGNPSKRNGAGTCEQTDMTKLKGVFATMEKSLKSIQRVSLSAQKGQKCSLKKFYFRAVI